MELSTAITGLLFLTRAAQQGQFLVSELNAARAAGNGISADALAEMLDKGDQELDASKKYFEAILAAENPQ